MPADRRLGRDTAMVEASASWLSAGFEQAAETAVAGARHAWRATAALIPARRPFRTIDPRRRRPRWAFATTEVQCDRAAHCITRRRAARRRWTRIERRAGRCGHHGRELDRLGVAFPRRSSLPCEAGALQLPRTFVLGQALIRRRGTGRRMDLRLQDLGQLIQYLSLNDSWRL